jgi:hypothetical protein
VDSLQSSVGEVDDGRKEGGISVALIGKLRSEISEVGDLDDVTTDLFLTFERRRSFYSTILYSTILHYYIIFDLVLSR